MASRETLRDLTAFLDSQGARYTLLEHVPYTSSEEATAITGIQPEQAAKALLYDLLGEYALAVLPASERVSSGKLRRALQVKSVSLARPEVVSDIMGCDVGTCYPIGRLLGIRTIVDPLLEQGRTIGFSTGDPTHSITMEYPEYLRVAQPEVQDICAERLI